MEETYSDAFECCKCLELLYKPVVLECGHAICFWCAYECMDPVQISNCPLCREPYHFLPNVCRTMHCLIQKMYPVAYDMRESGILDQERARGCFSPHLEISDEGEANEMCPTCKQFLYRPAALNCGHVFCESCIVAADDGSIKCKVCESTHQGDFPKVCTVFLDLLKEIFPNEYGQRENVVQRDNPSCSRSKKSAKKSFVPFSETDDDFLPWWNEHGSQVNAGVGCDNCGMYPIIGDRYSCRDCIEMIGFDLCGDCYTTPFKQPAKFKQQHTPNHRCVLVKHPHMLGSMISCLTEHYEASSQDTPPAAVNEDSPSEGVESRSIQS